jgi:hypothetical protein
MNPWTWLPAGYLLTVLIEAPLLLVGLSPCHSIRRKLFAAFWLTAITYPVVVLILPPITGGHYLLVAETFAPACECAVFLYYFGGGRTARDASLLRDAAAIVAANLASFAVGWMLFWH